MKERIIFNTKYDDINKELNALYYQMKKANYSDKYIRKKFAPILAKIPKGRDRFFTCVCIFFTFIMGIFLLTYWDAFYWHLSAIARIFLINILPHFNWRYLKTEPCLIPKLNFFDTEKPNFVNGNVFFNCHTCEDLKTVQYFGDIDEDVLIRKYLETNVPVVLRKGLDHWRYDVQDFLEKISSQNDFWYSHPCKLSSNIHSEGIITVGKIFQKTEFFDSFFLHFQNCEKPAKRIFRNFTYRPDFLPEVYSPTVFNWLVWTKNYTNPNYRKIELTEKITVFGQIHGISFLRLLPRKNCEFDCRILNFQLKVGEYVIFTPLWDLEYRQLEEGENLAAILEVRD